MYFKRALAAVLGGGLLAALAVPAAAQGTATPQPAIFRFPLGVQFELPPGWSWSRLEFNSAFNSVVVSYDATQPRETSKQNPNSLQVVFNPKAAATETPQAAKDWTRVDTDRSQALPNGARVRWKIGRKWNAHEVINGGATIGSTTLGFNQTDGSTRTFNPALLQDVLMKIAGSMRVVPPSGSYFHPDLRMAIDPPDAKRWRLDTTRLSFTLHCLTCGNTNKRIVVSPSKTPRTDVNSALAVLTDGARKQESITIGEVRRELMADGEFAWAEQPGSGWPYLGAFRRGEQYFFISLWGDKTTAAMDADLRNDFLVTARGVRVWKGE